MWFAHASSRTAAADAEVVRAAPVRAGLQSVGSARALGMRSSDSRVGAKEPGDGPSDTRLQILRRERTGTRLDWLEATRDVTSQHLAPEQRPSPFIAHHGVSAADSDRRYTIATYSNDGRFLARVHSVDSPGVESVAVVTVLSTSTGALLMSIAAQSPADTVQGVAFSPGGTYLVVCSKFRTVAAGSPSSVWTVRSGSDADEGGGEERQISLGQDGVMNNNLALWRVDTATLESALCTHQHWDPDRWPYVEWRAADSVGAVAIPGALKVLAPVAANTSTAPVLRVATRLALESREPSTFAMAPVKRKAGAVASLEQILQAGNAATGTAQSESTPQQMAALRLAVFVQDPKGDHRVDILEYDFAGSAAGSLAEEECWTTISTLKLSGAEDVSLKWSVDGSALLVLSTTHIDDTNTHYYGTSSLHLMYRCVE